MSNRPMGARPDPVGVILAGGIGRRIGGSKATVQLRGRPLICYPLAALQGALDDVAVIAKAQTKLPRLSGVTVWIEPEGPSHPLFGIAQALALAEGRAVLACATDLPFVTSELVRRIAAAGLEPDTRAAVVAWRDELQPLLGCYHPAVAPMLRQAAQEGIPARDVVARIAPRQVVVQTPEELFNINTPDDLLQAAAMLDQRTGYPKVKS